MAILKDTLKSIRLAGSALGGYLSNPATYQQLGKKVALETALGTAAQQAVPRLLRQPAPGIGRSLASTAVHSAMTQPIVGGMSAMGAPEWAANMTGSILGSAGAALATQAMTRNIPEPEPHQAPHPHLVQLMQLQQMQAAAEQQRYNNQINLAYAKNYNPPSVIVHKNPSADMETIYNMINPRVSY